MMRPLDICVTGDASSPHESERAQALVRLGHRVRIVSPVPAKVEGISVTVPWGGQIGFAPIRRLVVMLATLWVVWREKVDVFHCHYAAEYTTWATALLGKKNLVITVMGGDVLFDEQGSQGAVGRALTRFALKRADLVTVKAPRLGHVIKGMGVAPERIMEVLWGIDIDAFQANPATIEQFRTDWGVQPDDLLFFSPRPLKPFYNQALMVQALARVCEKYPSAKLVMSSYAEEPGFRDELTELARDLGIADALIFVAPCAHGDMAHLYGACDVVLSIPPSDGFPQTLIEAAAIGKPCIMTGPDKFEELIRPDEHALFADLNAQDLSAKCLALADDRALSKQIAENALAFSRKRADLMQEATRVSDRMLRMAGITKTSATRERLDICVLAAANADHTYHQCAIMRDLGHNVSLVSQNMGVCPDGVKHIPCNIDSHEGVWGKLRWLIAISNGVRSVNADVFHAQYAAELTTWMAWLLRKKPLVISCLGGDVLFEEQPSIGPFGRWLTRQGLRSCDQVTVVSNYLGDRVEAFGVPRSKIHRVIWGINHDVFFPDVTDPKVREEWGVASDAKVIFSPRQLKPLYNHDLMVKAFSLIAKQKPDAVLLLATYNQDAEYRTQIESLIDSLDLRSKIRFLPVMSAQEMNRAYNAADVVVSLPPSDGTPVSVMEAMACGAPVVMTNLERFRELFEHKKTAWFTELQPDLVAEGVLMLLDDPVLCSEVKKNAMTLIKENADLNVQAHLLEDIFYELVESKGADNV